MVSYERCELHEITNCSTCTGVDKKYEASVAEEAFTGNVDDPLPLIYGAKVIRAGFPGNCAGCGERFPKYAPIFVMKGETGWKGVHCCAS